MTLSPKSRLRHLHSCIAAAEDTARWPIGGAELSNLIELGLSDEVIACYFGVARSKVVALRNHFGIEPRQSR
jgi:hypothetical protein